MWSYKCIFGVSYDKVSYLTSEDYICQIISHHHNIQILFASNDIGWKVSLKVVFLFSCLSSLWHIYRDGYWYVAVLQDCLELLSWFMSNGQFPFWLYASRIYPDKRMECTVKRKLSLGIFLWSYGRTFCHIWTIMCREWHTLCMPRAAKPDFRKPHGMITEWSLTFSPNKQTNSMVWVRGRTIPTERPPLVGEVIANFWG
jgi:hypothetical protein